MLSKLDPQLTDWKGQAVNASLPEFLATTLSQMYGKTAPAVLDLLTPMFLEYWDKLGLNQWQHVLQVNPDTLDMSEHALVDLAQAMTTFPHIGRTSSPFGIISICAMAIRMPITAIKHIQFHRNSHILKGTPIPFIHFFLDRELPTYMAIVADVLPPMVPPLVREFYAACTPEIVIQEHTFRSDDDRCQYEMKLYHANDESEPQLSSQSATNRREVAMAPVAPKVMASAASPSPALSGTQHSGSHPLRYTPGGNPTSAVNASSSTTRPVRDTTKGNTNHNMRSASTLSHSTATALGLEDPLAGLSPVPSHAICPLHHSVALSPTASSRHSFHSPGFFCKSPAPLAPTNLPRMNLPSLPLAKLIWFGPSLSVLRMK